jgi:hypothetical protein
LDLLWISGKGGRRQDYCDEINHFSVAVIGKNARQSNVGRAVISASKSDETSDATTLSAKGASSFQAWGRVPGIVSRQRSLKARIAGNLTRHLKPRFQRSSILARHSWGVAPGCDDHRAAGAKDELTYGASIG